MTTPNLGLIELTNSQGQYLNANETFAILDALVGKVVKDKDLNTPPGSPADGDVYIVGPTPTGLWSSQGNKITFWSADASEWVFITPREGWKFEPVDEDITYRYSGSAWVEWSAGGGDWDALATPAISGGTLTINLADPTWYRVTLNQNVTTITFTNFPTGKVPVFAIEFVQDGTGGRTVVFPGSIVADDGGSIPSPATAANASTVYTLSSSDNGTTYKYASGVENGFTVSVGAVNEAPLTTIASAATVNLATATSNTINISGTTTITAFGTIAAGATRRLIFQGALTLTHNATSLILPGGANITTAAGDAAEFVSLGSGNWKCYTFERANGTSVSLGPTSSPTFAALTLTNGQIAFPAVQVPSANANTLDDYEEGTFTPTITFATPGDLSVAYATQIGLYTKVGRMCAFNFTVTTSTFTHTTASGALTVAGLPFTGVSGSTATSTVRFLGITKAGFSDYTSLVAGAVNTTTFVACNSGATFSTVVAADTPSGGTVSLTSALVYHVA